MPMCRRASNMWKPEPGASATRPRLLMVSNMDVEAIGNPDAKLRTAEPDHHRREQIRSVNSPLCFVKNLLRLVYRNK